MSRTKQVVKTTSWKRTRVKVPFTKKYRYRMAKVKQDKRSIIRDAPKKPSELQIIGQETSPVERSKMYREYQRGKNIRAGLRNLTAQTTTAGAQIMSGVHAGQGLSQNIAGGASIANTSRDGDSGDDEDEGGGSRGNPWARKN